MLNNRVTFFLSRFCCLRSLHVLFPGVCKCSLGESANVGARACVLKTMRSYEIGGARWWSLVDISGTSVKLLHFIWQINTIVIDHIFDSSWG